MATKATNFYFQCCVSHPLTHLTPTKCHSNLLRTYPLAYPRPLKILDKFCLSFLYSMRRSQCPNRCFFLSLQTTPNQSSNGIGSSGGTTATMMWTPPGHRHAPPPPPPPPPQSCCRHASITATTYHGAGLDMYFSNLNVNTVFC
jgi:hypothetical protein